MYEDEDHWGGKWRQIEFHAEALQSSAISAMTQTSTLSSSFSRRILLYLHQMCYGQWTSLREGAHSGAQRIFFISLIGPKLQPDDCLSLLTALTLSSRGSLQG